MASKPPTPPNRTGASIRPLFAGGLVVTLSVLAWLTLAAGDPLDEYEMTVETSLMESVYVTAIALDAEFEATGSLPDDLESIGMDEEGLTYERTPDGYRLSAREEGVVVAYRSGEDLRPFREAFNRLLPPHMVTP